MKLFSILFFAGLSALIGFGTFDAINNSEQIIKKHDETAYRILQTVQTTEDMLSIGEVLSSLLMVVGGAGFVISKRNQTS